MTSAGIELLTAEVAAALPRLPGELVDLVHVDGPWTYDNGSGRDVGELSINGAQSRRYGGLSVEAIAADLVAAYRVAKPDAYALAWVTWPFLMPFAFELGRLYHAGKLPWEPLSGGAWGKLGGPGIGFHWRGKSEPVLLFRKGRPKPHRDDTENLWLTRRDEHSEKPLEALVAMTTTFSPPGGMVLDLYSGLAPLARVCASHRRRYLGIEASASRNADALRALRLHLECIR